MIRSPTFVIGTAIKLVCLPFFGSVFATDLFIPFLDAAVQSPGTNPWAQMEPQFFPYGTVLFSLLYIPRLMAFKLAGTAALGAGGLGMALIKLPLLGLDFGLLRILEVMAPGHRRSLMWFYWLNPVLFYITYVHVQLDVAVMFFCCLSLLWILQLRVGVAGVAMAAAVLCKAHVLILIPFMGLYLWHRSFLPTAVRNLATWLTTFLLCALAGFSPHALAGHAAYVTATSPEAMRLFAAQLHLGFGHVLYVGFALVLATLGRLCASTHISDRGLIFGSGFLMGALLIATSTMPGWHFWVMPFVALLYSVYSNVPLSLYGFYCCAYLVYFALLPLWPGELPELVTANAFTLLQTVVGGLLVTMWTFALRAEVPVQRLVRPLLLGIAGDSGTGKDRLSIAFADLFEAHRTAVLAGDDYHRWERGNVKWNDYTHLNPQANHLEQWATHAVELLSGRRVTQPHYDHATGTFTPPREIRSRKLLIVQGLHALYLRGMRSEVDLKIFLDPNPMLRLCWKIGRDIRERGYPSEQVIAAMNLRQSDAQTHIQPQRSWADWIIEMQPVEPFAQEDALLGKVPAIKACHVLWNDAPINALCGCLNALEGISATLHLLQGDMQRVQLTITGEPSVDQIRTTGEALFPRLRALTHGRHAPRWQGGHDGINQLIALTLLEKRRAHEYFHSPSVELSQRSLWRRPDAGRGDRPAVAGG